MREIKNSQNNDCVERQHIIIVKSNNCNRFNKSVKV